MERTPNTIPPPLHLRSLATRAGHEAVWLVIAGLFYVVEGAVKLTELSPTRFLRARRESVLPGAAPAHAARLYAR